MSRKKILICDREKEYARRFQEVMNELHYEAFETLAFYSEKTLNEYLEKNTGDVLITSALRPPKNKEAVKRILKLSEDKPEADESEVIFKYAPLNETVSKIVDILVEFAKPEMINKSRNMEIVGVYTPIKRCFQTTFSICLGQIMAKEKKVLYLNFEGFSGFDYITGKAAKADIMDALYFAECGTASFALRLESMIEKIGELDYIAPTKAFTNLGAVTPNQWMKLLDMITEETDYDVLIMDLSEQVNGLLQILDRSTRVFTIVDSERIAKAKIAQYELLLRELNYISILNKTKSLSIPRFREIPKEFEMLPYSELANYVKQTIEEGV